MSPPRSRRMLFAGSLVLGVGIIVLICIVVLGASLFAYEIFFQRESTAWPRIAVEDPARRQAIGAINHDNTTGSQIGTSRHAPDDTPDLIDLNPLRGSLGSQLMQVGMNPAGDSRATVALIARPSRGPACLAHLGTSRNQSLTREGLGHLDGRPALPDALRPNKEVRGCDTVACQMRLERVR